MGRLLLLAAAVLFLSTAAEPAFAIPGACCLSDHSCVLLGRADCLAAGGHFWGEGTPCVPDPCRPGLGVCCPYSGECTITTFVECTEISNVCGWMEGETSCDPNPCPACCPTACCMPDGRCELVMCTEDCVSIGGVPASGRNFCHPNPCWTTDVPDGDDTEGARHSATWGEIRAEYR